MVLCSYRYGLVVVGFISSPSVNATALVGDVLSESAFKSVAKTFQRVPSTHAAAVEKQNPHHLSLLPSENEPRLHTPTHTRTSTYDCSGVRYGGSIRRSPRLVFHAVGIHSPLGAGTLENILCLSGFPRRHLLIVSVSGDARTISATAVSG